MSQSDPNEFEAAAELKEHSLIAEFWGFLGQNKKWWLAPIILVLLLLGTLAILTSSAMAPFIYTLF